MDRAASAEDGRRDGAPADQAVLSAERIGKAFSGVEVLRDADLRCAAVRFMP